MSAEKKPNEIEIWKQFLDQEYHKMQEELRDVSDPKLRSHLRDELKWLKHQMTSFQASQDITAIQEDLEWVAKSFNHKLNPDSPFRRQP